MSLTVNTQEFNGQHPNNSRCWHLPLPSTCRRSICEGDPSPASCSFEVSNVIAVHSNIYQIYHPCWVVICAKLAKSTAFTTPGFGWDLSVWSLQAALLNLDGAPWIYQLMTPWSLEYAILESQTGWIMINKSCSHRIINNKCYINIV